MNTSVENRSGGVLAFIIFIDVITVIFVSLRFWARTITPQKAHRKLHLFWWDDWCVLVAAVFLLIQLAMEIVLIQVAGFGQHIWTFSEEQKLLFWTLVYAAEFFFFVAIGLTKLSVLFFLTRVFPPRANSRLFNIALWTCYGLNGTWLIGILSATIFICNPVQKSWNPSLPGTCGSQFDLYLGNAIPSAIIDLFILLLPLPKIWSLQISIGRRVGLLITFVLGYAVIVVSIGRAVQTVRTGDALNTDYPWEAIPVLFWITAEPGISVVCACLPAMWPLGRRFTQWLPCTNGRLNTIGRKATIHSTFRRGPYRTTTSIDDDTLQQEDYSAILNGYSPANGGREAFALSPANNSYHAHAIRNLSGDLVDITVPPHSIHVERNVDISSFKDSARPEPCVHRS